VGGRPPAWGETAGVGRWRLAGTGGVRGIAVRGGKGSARDGRRDKGFLAGAWLC